MQSAWQLVKLAAERTPDNIAVMDCDTGRHRSYRDLVVDAERLAAGLYANGVQPRLPVATTLPNTLEHVLVLLALARLDAETVLINPRLKPPEVAEILNRCQVGMSILPESSATEPPGDVQILRVDSESAFSFQAFERLGEALPATTPQPEDGAYVFLTSGTTGAPKAVRTPHRATEPRVLFMCTQVGLRHGPHNRLLGLMPLSHNIGFYAVMLTALALNGTYYVCRGPFDPGRTLETIRQREISCLFASPTHYHGLVNHPTFAPERVSSVADVVYAGATMPQRLLTDVAAGFEGRITQIYGTTETMNSLYMPDPISQPQTLQPGYYSRVRIAPVDGRIEQQLSPREEGEIVVDASSDATFLEYVGDPQETARRMTNGWYRTGDAGFADESGNIVVCGRVDDMIVTGAENIHPVEVEEVLATCLGVGQVAVFGVPDERWGKQVTAAVVTDGSRLDTEILDDHCRTSPLADFKRPRRYLFVNELPRNASGKVQRAQLAQLAKDNPA